MLHRRTVLYSHSKRNRYPQQTHTLSLSKYNTLLWWAWLHFSKSVDFRCFDWCDYFYQKNPLISLHTQKNYYNPIKYGQFQNCVTLKLKHPRWAMGKGSGGGAAGLWGGQRRCGRFEQLGKGRRRAARGRRRRRDGFEIKRVLQSVAL